MNPLNNNNPFNRFMQFLNSGGNPQQFANQILQQNPHIRQTMEQLYSTSAGQNPRDIAMQLIKEKGIDPNQIMQIANKMGLK